MKKRILIILLSFMFSQDTLYFVYNAKGDILSVVGDFFHKSLSPKTYPCRLCELSYGAFAKKKIWKDFLDSLDIRYEFVYKNEIDRFKQEIKSFPVILIGRENNVAVFLSKEAINNTKDIQTLIDKINLKLESGED